MMHRVNGFQRSSLLAVLTTLALAPAAHADATGADIVGFLNAERAANGLPAGLTEDTAASAACAAWTGAQHPTSGPQPTPPSGATTWSDGTGLGGLGPWTATQNPFAPYTMALTTYLAPRLASLGAAESNGVGCVTATDTSRPAPAADVTYTYPGDATTGARTSQLSASPSGFTFDPATGALADPPQTTGGAAYAFFDGPDFDPAHPAAAKATSASLTGPGGADVPVYVRDATTAVSTASMPTEVQLVPKAELKPFTTYTASVAADVTPAGGGATRPFTRTWSFTTGALENFLQIEWAQHYDSFGTDPSTLTVALTSRAPHVTATATGPGTTATASADTVPMPPGDARVTLRLDQHGPWHICVQSGGAGTDYKAASTCTDVVGGAAPKAPPAIFVPNPAPRRTAPKLKVSLLKTAKARWRGRTVTVSGVRCSAACTLRVGGTVKLGGKAVRLGSKTVSRKGAGVVTIKYTISKSLAARLRRAHVRKVALTIVPKGGRAVRAALAFSAAK